MNSEHPSNEDATRHSGSVKTTPEPVVAGETLNDDAVRMALILRREPALEAFRQLQQIHPKYMPGVLNYRWLQAREFRSVPRERHKVFMATALESGRQPPIYGFLHIATNGRWRDIVDEQIRKARESGLLDATTTWFVSVIGPEAQSWQPPDAKMKVIHRHDRFDDAEFPILRHMREFCNRHDAHVFYVHTKGVFHAPGPVDDWRRYMEHFVLERYVDCVKHLSHCDVAGVNWHTAPWPHFSGNFWWARSEHIRSLPPIDLLTPMADIDFGRRHLCERWIGERPELTAASLFESGLDHYHLAYPRDRYASDRPMGTLKAEVFRHAPVAPIVETKSVVGTKRPIMGFVHVALLHHWRHVLDEQITKMQASGLWDELDQLVIGCVGPGDPALKFTDPRVKIVHHDSPLEEGERPTLSLLHRQADQHPDGAFFYIHTKGVSRPDASQEEWRRSMEHFALLRYADCLSGLNDHDICGINWDDSGWCRFFAGNFWWARADYLRTLPDISKLEVIAGLDASRRHVCERWIGENPGVRAKSFFQAHTDHYAGQSLPRSLYARVREVQIDEGFKPTAWAGLENRFQDLLEPVDDIRLVVEIGVEWGFSLLCLAKALPHATVIGIDPYESLSTEEIKRLMSLDARGVQGTPESRRWIQDQLKRYRNAILLRTTHEAASRQFVGSIDVLHLDAVHQYVDVRRMFRDWEPHIRPGGCVLMHDTLAFPRDVGRFFDELPGRKANLRVGCGLGAWYKPHALSSAQYSGARG